MMKGNMNFLFLGLGILVVIVLICMFTMGKKKEGFAVDGSLNGGVNIGGIAQNTYDLVEPTMDTFADIVAPSEPYASTGTCTQLPLPVKAGANIDSRDLLPDVNTHATSYDIDVTDPEVFMWRPSIRTAIHNRQHETADPLRGDLPITKDGCGYSNNGWFTSRYNEGDARLDAYFSDFSKYKFRSLTGQKSYPQYIANEGLVMDAHPSPPADEMVMDWY